MSEAESHRYKPTILLPATEFPMRGDLPKREPALFAKLHEYPNLIMWMAGHRHYNVITAFKSPDPTRPELGFWQVETSSLRDYPQQFRMFEIIRNSDDTILRNAIVPTLKDGVSSMPLLPMNGSRGGVQLQQPFTTNAVVTLSGRSVDHSTLSTAESPWRVVALPWTDEDGKPGGVCYIGLSLSDQLDTVKTLTRYCIIVGVAIVAAPILYKTMLPALRHVLNKSELK